jgi:hypothetical protein
MRWYHNGIAASILLWAAACALESIAGDSEPPLAQSMAPSSSTWTTAELAPPPAAMVPPPSPLIFDSPVPYYSAIYPADDPTQFDPRLELDPNEVKLGWLVLAELDYVHTFIHNGLNSGALLAGSLPGPVSVPAAQPGWNAMPRIDLGYRFDSGLGEFHAIFRTLNAQGSTNVVNFDAAGAGTLSSHINLNVLDLDYGYTEINPGRIPRLNPFFLIPGRLGLNLRPEEDPFPFRLKWAAGARMANVFFDSQGVGNQILNERVTNNFVGGGIHASVDLAKPFAWRPALGVYARADFSGLWGQINQNFARTELLPGGGVATGAGRVRSVDSGVPILEAELGLTYTPPAGPCWLRFISGYRYEQWWYLGQTSSSNAGLTLQGVFFRGEWGY